MARRSAGVSSGPVRRMSRQTLSPPFTYPPSAAPRAIPATPNGCIRRNAAPADTATDTAATRTGVLVSPRA